MRSIVVAATPPEICRPCSEQHLILTACAGNTNRDDFDNDCDYARAYYAEMQQSVRTYYALGTTSVAEIAVAERKVKEAKEQVQTSCGNN